VIILRRGKEVARLVPPEGEDRPLPSLKEFRASIRITGQPLRDSAIQERQEGRYECSMWILPSLLLITAPNH
jgi:antitoxin (DNA-binding transcriptional repressor) of toxin-antitoxin stability system